MPRLALLQTSSIATQANQCSAILRPAKSLKANKEKEVKKRYFHISFWHNKDTWGFGEIWFSTTDGKHFNRKEIVSIIEREHGFTPPVVIIAFTEMSEEDYSSFSA